ncbi:MAG: hypothetical protein GDA41_05350 [Rhodospirillales bacterium]|nr:hypothetical protein [Rhodospirillales bacterium]
MLARWRRYAALCLHLALLLLIVLPFRWILLHLALPVSVTLLMVIRLLDGHGWTHSWTDLQQIHPYLAVAVGAAENNRFGQHRGID